MHLTNKFVSEIGLEAGILEKWKKGKKGGAAERSIPALVINLDGRFGQKIWTLTLNVL